ncbi:Kelch repeat-containing protein 3 [Naganishia albida]|nr:Kelch repeat-containing protein 3 [Naganishia albida]
MGKSKSSSKSASKLAKAAKQEEKAAKSELKAIKGGKGKDENLEDILAQFQAEWKTKHAVKEEVQLAAPSRRVNATFTAFGDHLWLIGGEYFDGDKAYLYNDTFRYNPDKNEWRLYTSPNAPAPRSAHAAVAIPKDGGQIWVFGGEYANPSQTNFYHYRDLWMFSLKDYTWQKIETKKGPTARSGHRMTFWKQYIVLYGGFHDTGVKTSYLSDLWVFDTETYKWKEVDQKATDRVPGARSGFSMIPAAEGVVIHGGYRKEYLKGSKSVGMALEDTWLLHMDLDLAKLKWEKRKKGGLAPSLRSGTSMTHWAAKGLGVLFGGVLDQENDEDLSSVFYNDLYTYNPTTSKWSLLTINAKKKKAGGSKKRRAKQAAVADPDAMAVDEDVDMEAAPEAEEDESEDDQDQKMTVVDKAESGASDVPLLPLTRSNAMIAVLKNTLYIYGGSYETEKREYTLDDFFALNLEKRDGYKVLRETVLDAEVWHGSDDEDQMDEDEDGEDDNGEDEDEDSSEDEE